MSRATTTLRALSAVVATVAAGASWATADSRCNASSIRDLVHETPAWKTLPSFRALSAECGASGSAGYRTYWMHFAQIESFAGNHATALSYFNKGLRSDRQRKPGSLPAAVRATPAAAYIARLARDHRIVIVNERHHVSPDRLLTMNLLEPLAALGFRYLALETATTADDPINERGYPVDDSGYYTKDVVFAQLVRSAIDIGFEIVAYEYDGDQWQRDQEEGHDDYGVRREYWQGRNIAERTIRNDPDAKVLVHCGWGHVYEASSSKKRMMAGGLAQLTGLDPLTVDQVQFADYGHELDDDPLRTAAKEQSLVGDEEVVLQGGDGERIRGYVSVDVHVFGRRTRYENGRPAWMAMDGRRSAVAFATPECETQPCIVEARSESQPDAVPFDRVEVYGDATTLYVPPEHASSGHVFRLDGTLVAQREIVAAPEQESD